MGKIKYIGCKVLGCLEPHRSRGFCRKHYRAAIWEGRKRYLKVKNNPTLLNTAKQALLRYRKTKAYNESKKKSDKKYYEKNRDLIRIYKMEWNELRRFGIKREEILLRDGYKCRKCNNSIVGELVVHHINGKGRSTNIPDNNLSNLVTLCRSCHMKIHLLIT